MNPIVAGKYTIGKRIGAGGMGEVFAAHDERLQRRVAIKALLPSLAGDAVARARFVREARLACRVTHPYVATVFDVLEHDGRVLLVMEYIDGRLLASVLAHERPATAVAARWLLEIGEALAAIHRDGLIHRDLKPGNVMVTGDGHVKLMDFGLARVVPPRDLGPDDSTLTGDPSLTAPGAVLGTLLYMSPEQLRGEPVDQRSDQFSFGVLAHQMLAGVHPFLRATAHESATAILREPPRGGDDTSALLQSPAAGAMVARLLQKNPEHRFPDTGAMLAALRLVSVALGAGTAPPSPSRWRLLVAGGAAGLAAVLGLAVLGWWWLHRPAEWDQPRYSVVIAPFQDQTGLDDGPLKAAALTDLLAIDLQGSRLVRAEGPAELRAIVAGLLPALDINEVVLRVVSGRTVDYVLTGNLFAEDRGLLATVVLEPTAKGVPQIPALRATGANAKDLAERLAGLVRHQLPGVPRLTAYRDDHIDLAAVTSRSEDARLSYERGLLALREEKLSASIEAFERAVTIDPAFCLAQAHLAVALDRAGYGRRAREAAERARRLAPPPNDPALERLALFIEATWADVFGRSEDAVLATERLAELFPDEPALLARLAQALRGANRYAAALAGIDRAIVLDPRNPSTRLDRAGLMRLSSRYDEALVAVEEAEASFKLVGSSEGLAAAMFERGVVFHAREQAAEAKDSLSRAAAMYDATGRPLSAAAARLEVAGLLLERGHLDDVEPWIAGAEATANSSGNLKLQCEAQTARAILGYYRRDFDAAETAYRAAIDLARQLESASLLAAPLANLSGLLVWRGRLEDARPLLDETIRVGRELGREDVLQSALISSADVAYQLGDYDSAIRLGREMVEQAGDPPQRFAVLGYLGLAAAYRERGELADALGNLDLAVGLAEALDLPNDLGRALINRARVRATLGREVDAALDLARAEALAGDLPELALVCVRTGAELLARKGLWREALERLRSDPEAGTSPASLRLVCWVRLRVGSPASAIDDCTRTVASPVLPAGERVEANAARARALLNGGQDAEAVDAATAALSASKRMGLVLQVARAAAVLVDARATADPERQAARRDGLAALETWLASAPQEDRPALENSEEVRALRRSLEKDTSFKTE